MGWQRMQSQEEKRKERIRGFMPFVEGANVEGKLEAVRLKDDGTGFFLIRATKSCTVNVRADDESKTGIGKAQIGELVGIRKTGATKVIRDIEIGTLISVTYLGMGERTAVNPKTGLEETNAYHHITVEVYKPELNEAA